jgi:hypothetical protein
MNNKAPFTSFKRQAFPVYLLLAAVISCAGCSTTRPTITPDSTVGCPAVPGEAPAQNAPDDCRKETCLDGRLTSIEDLTETAPVSGWAEEGFCFFHPIDCFRALSVKNHVRQWEQDKANAGSWDRASLQSGLGDAARHAYLGCLLTEQFGAEFAKGLLDAHEEDSSLMFGFGKAVAGNRCCDKLMDLSNNRLGIELAAKPGGCEEKVMNSLHLLRHSLCGK